MVIPSPLLLVIYSRMSSLVALRYFCFALKCFSHVHVEEQTFAAGFASYIKAEILVFLNLDT